MLNIVTTSCIHHIMQSPHTLAQCGSQPPMCVPTIHTLRCAHSGKRSPKGKPSTDLICCLCIFQTAYIVLHLYSVIGKDNFPFMDLSIFIQFHLMIKTKQPQQFYNYSIMITLCCLSSIQQISTQFNVGEGQPRNRTPEK